MGNSLSTDEINLRLHEAVSRGDLKELEKYLKKSGDLNKLLENEQFEKPPNTNTDGPAQKSNGTAFDNLVDALALEDHDKSSFTTSDSNGKKSLRMNALHRAASRKNNLKILQFVVNRVDDVDKQDTQGDTAMHYVSMFNNNDESVKLLLNFKPNINLQNDRGETALYSAVSHGCDMKIIEWLLKGGASPNICDEDGNTPLHVCALKRGIDPLIPGILLRFGANPNLKNKQGQTPLHVAARTTNNAVLLLLKFNAKVRLRDNAGHRPSEIATSEEMRKVLLEEENDLLERTTRTSDIIERGEAAFLATAPRGTAHSVQSWLNGQNSIDSASDFERNGSLRSDNGRSSQIFYPRRSKSGRMSIESYYNKFAGGGGDGVIELPNNREIIIPPDAMPLGTHLKLTISSNESGASLPDLTGLDFKFDIKIQLPGKSLLPPGMGQEDTRAPPVFTGMCLEGDTSWQCMRELGEEAGTDSQLKFSLKKEKCVPLIKRVSQIQVPASVENTTQAVNEGKARQSDDGSSAADDSNEGNIGLLETPGDAPLDSLLNEKFWARRVLVVKEASETSGSCDGSEADSFAEEDFRRQPDLDEDTYHKYDSCMDEPDETNRIQHPIDQELATITEEESNAMEPQDVEQVSPRTPSEEFTENQAPLGNNEQLAKDRPSLDSGYRGSVDFDE